MPDRFFIKDKDIRNFNSRLKKMSTKVGDTKPVNKKIGVILDRWVLNNFRTQGRLAYPGRGWTPFAYGGRYDPETHKVDRNAKLLQDTGRLYRSFFPAFYDKNKVGIGSSVPYAKKHNEGLDFLPERRMIPKLSDVDKDVLKTYEDHMRKSLK